MNKKSDEFKFKELEKRKKFYEKIKELNTIGAEATTEEKTINEVRESFPCAYFAGLIDGEGCLNIYKKKEREKSEYTLFPLLSSGNHFRMYYSIIES